MWLYHQIRMKILNKRFSYLKSIRKNHEGVAILMVLTAITLLTAILTDFTFESKLNKLKVYNSQDKSQAKFNAESGLLFAMARLKLYQEAFNTLEKNEAAKGQFKQEDLNQIWNMPFVYPIPGGDKMSIIQRSALADFEKNSMIQGEMKVEILNASHLLNLNLLRISPLVKKPEPEKKSNNNQGNENENENAGDGTIDPEFGLEKQLSNLLKESIEKKRETDDEFNNKYADKDAVELVSGLKHFTSDENAYEDAFSQQFEANYSNKDFTVKHAPYSSLTEIYLVDGWDDQIVDLLYNDLTVHGVAVIDLNKITNKTLKILLPNLDEEQIKEFFKYRDDPVKPKPFNNLADFKTYIVNTANLMSEANFNERMKKFEQAGLKFGVAGSLFKVITSGTYGRSTYTLTAYVSLPAKPAPKPAPKATPVANTNTSNTTEETTPNNSSNQGEDKDKNKKTPLELLLPRVVEITASS